jgi:monoamine oxidase
MSKPSRKEAPPVQGSQAQPDLDATLAQVRELNEQMLEFSRKADSAYLDSYEKTLRALVEFQKAVADANDDQRTRALAKAYANFAEEVTSAYVTAARELRQ